MYLEALRSSQKKLPFYSPSLVHGLWEKVQEISLSYFMPVIPVTWEAEIRRIIV
jgi:hypothetical protein